MSESDNFNQILRIRFINVYKDSIYQNIKDSIYSNARFTHSHDAVRMPKISIRDGGSLI